MNKSTKAFSRRLISFLLVVMLLVSQVAVVAFADPVSYTYLAFTSDVHGHPDHNDPVNRLKSWLPAVAKVLGISQFDTFGSCGDMGWAYGGVSEDGYWKAVGQLMSAVDDSGLAAHSAFTTGNHEIHGPGYFKDDVTYTDAVRSRITRIGNPYAGKTVDEENVLVNEGVKEFIDSAEAADEIAEEIPAVEELPAVEEVSAVEENPTVEEAPAAEEVPAAEEKEPEAAEEIPAAEETAEAEEPAPADAVPGGEEIGGEIATTEVKEPTASEFMTWPWEKPEEQDPEEEKDPYEAPAYDPQGYKVFCLGAAPDNFQKFTDADIDALESFLFYCDPTEPVFVLSHYPIHSLNSGRAISNTDALLEVLNQYPNVVFLWGHNHTDSDPNYCKVFTGAINGGIGKINFTYASAGCMSDDEYSEGSDSVEGKGLVARVGDDKSLTLTYYSEEAEVVCAYEITIGETQASSKKLTASELAENYTDEKEFIATDTLVNGKQYVISAESMALTSTRHDGYSTTNGYSYYGFKGGEVDDDAGRLIAGVTKDMIWTAEKTSAGWAFKNDEGKYLNSEYTSNQGGGLFLDSNKESWTYDTTLTSVDGSKKCFTFDADKDVYDTTPTAGEANLFLVRSTGDAITFYQVCEVGEYPGEDPDKVLEVGDYKLVSGLKEDGRYLISSKNMILGNLYSVGYITLSSGNYYHYSGLSGYSIPAGASFVKKSTVPAAAIWIAEKDGSNWKFKNEDSGKYLVSSYGASSNPGIYRDGVLTLSSDAESWTFSNTLKSQNSDKCLSWEGGNVTGTLQSGTDNLFSVRSGGQTISFYEEVTEIVNIEEGDFVPVDKLTPGTQVIITSQGQGMTSVEAEYTFNDTKKWVYSGFSGKTLPRTEVIKAGEAAASGYAVWTVETFGNGYAFKNADGLYLYSVYSNEPEDKAKGNHMIGVHEDKEEWSSDLKSTASKKYVKWDTDSTANCIEKEYPGIFTVRSGSSGIQYYQKLVAEGEFEKVTGLEDGAWYVITAEGMGMTCIDNSGYNHPSSGWKYEGFSGMPLSIGFDRISTDVPSAGLWQAIKVPGGWSFRNRNGLYLDASYGTRENGGYICASEDSSRAWVYRTGKLKTMVENNKEVFLTWDTDGGTEKSLFTIRSNGDDITFYKASEAVAEKMNEDHPFAYYTAGENGSVSLSKEALFDGEIAAGSTASANTGYHFVNWTNPEGEEVGTDAKFVPTAAGTYTANFAENEKVKISYAANLNTEYSDEPIGKVDVLSEEVAPVTGIPTGSTATAYTGYHFVNWTDKKGNVVSDVATFVPSKSGTIYEETTYFANFDRNPDCVGARYVALEGDDNYVLEINGTRAGTFKLQHIADCWTIQDLSSGKYLAVNRNKVVSSDSFDYFHYDGGFYVNHGGLLGKSKVYLTFEKGSFKTTDRATDVDVLREFSYMYHEYESINVGTVHLDRCTVCGEQHESEHKYNEADICVQCGAHKNGSVDQIYMNVSTQQVRRIILTHTVYTATIYPTGTAIVSKIEYNLNDKGWKTGNSVTSESEIKNLRIRITDNKGEVTEWLYNGSTVVKSLY